MACRPRNLLPARKPIGRRGPQGNTGGRWVPRHRPAGRPAAERVWSGGLAASSVPLPQRSALGLYASALGVSRPRALGPGLVERSSTLSEPRAQSCHSPGTRPDLSGPRAPRLGCQRLRPQASAAGHASMQTYKERGWSCCAAPPSPPPLRNPPRPTLHRSATPLALPSTASQPPSPSPPPLRHPPRPALHRSATPLAPSSPPLRHPSVLATPANSSAVKALEGHLE